MSPAPAAKAGAGGAGLKKKFGGLPVWAWGGLALLSVGVFIYMKRRGAGGQDAGTTAPNALTSDTAGAAGDTSAPSLGGTPAGDSLGSSGITQADLATFGQQIQSALDAATASAGMGVGGLDSGGSGVGPGSSGDGGSDGTTTGTVAAAAKTAPKGFWWGGSFFGPGGKSFAQFKGWETAHGGKVNQVFLAQHPAIEKAFNLPVLPPPPARTARPAPAPRRPAPRRPAVKKVAVKRAPARRR